MEVFEERVREVKCKDGPVGIGAGPEIGQSVTKCKLSSATFPNMLDQSFFLIMSPFFALSPFFSAIRPCFISADPNRILQLLASRDNLSLS